MKITKKFLQEVAEQHNKDYPGGYWKNGGTRKDAETKEPKHEGWEDRFNYHFRFNSRSGVFEIRDFSRDHAFVIWRKTDDMAYIKGFIREEIQKAEQRVLDEIYQAIKNDVQKSNDEVLTLDDHDERRVAGRHYRTVLGKHIAFIEFSKIVEEIRERVEKR